MKPVVVIDRCAGPSKLTTIPCPLVPLPLSLTVIPCINSMLMAEYDDDDYGTKVHHWLLGLRFLCRSIGSLLHHPESTSPPNYTNTASQTSTLLNFHQTISQYFTTTIWLTPPPKLTTIWFTPPPQFSTIRSTPPPEKPPHYPQPFKQSPPKNHNSCLTFLFSRSYHCSDFSRSQSFLFKLSKSNVNSTYMSDIKWVEIKKVKIKMLWGSYPTYHLCFWQSPIYYLGQARFLPICCIDGVAVDSNSMQLQACSHSE